MNECYKCQHFQRYYVKGTTQYERTKIGRCCVKGGTVESMHTCESFKLRPKLISSFETELLKLSELLSEISEMRKFLEEKFSEQDLQDL